MKRFFDVTLSIIALFVFSIPILIIILLLKFKEKHSIFFVQERIGKEKQPFKILKFQTLVDGKPTSTGKILRKTGLDEVAQFINVLKGDMSIVGPRALTMYDIKRLDWDDKFHTKRWSIKPGITGLAQLYGGQHRKLSWFWDSTYLEHNQLLNDFGIILLSFLMNIFGKTRVRRIIWPNKNLN
jgi:lipopolysaccharide/colanic/teichoic acid biosynthesis glycosyltransferase